MTAPERLDEWARRLRHAAQPVLAGTPVLDAASSLDAGHAFITGFRDELGHRRPVDRALLTVLLGLAGQAQPAGGLAEPSRSPDVELWFLLARRGAWAPPAWLRASGPVASDGMEGAIEVWTETELSCMHALWTVASRDDNAALRNRCLAAADWMIENVQPDNGTNHPWAIHLFAWMWAAADRADARLYAESMLHNCMVSLGRPDRFSACVLWHAANELVASASEQRR